MSTLVIDIPGIGTHIQSMLEDIVSGYSRPMNAVFVIIHEWRMDQWEISLNTAPNSRYSFRFHNKKDLKKTFDVYMNPDGYFRISRYTPMIIRPHIVQVLYEYSKMIHNKRSRRLLPVLSRFLKKYFIC